MPPGGRSSPTRSVRSATSCRSTRPRSCPTTPSNALIDEALAATGATSPKEMGKVMGFVMGKAKGQVDGTVVQQKVLERLNES